MRPSAIRLGINSSISIWKTVRNSFFPLDILSGRHTDYIDFVHHISIMFKMAPSPNSPPLHSERFFSPESLPCVPLDQILFHSCVIPPAARRASMPVHHIIGLFGWLSSVCFACIESPPPPLFRTNLILYIILICGIASIQPIMGSLTSWGGGQRSYSVDQILIKSAFMGQHERGSYHLFTLPLRPQFISFPFWPVYEHTRSLYTPVSIEFQLILNLCRDVVILNMVYMTHHFSNYLSVFLSKYTDIHILSRINKSMLLTEC